MQFYTRQSDAFWTDLDCNSIGRSRTASLLIDTGGWKSVQPVSTPDGAVRQIATPPGVTLRAYSIVKDIYRERFPREQFEELIWGYNVANVLAGDPRSERVFNIPESAPSVVLSRYWWNEVFQLVREEVLRGLPFGTYLAPIAQQYRIAPQGTYHRLLSELDKLDSAAWCDPSQRHLYFRDRQAIQEIVVPYLLLDWLDRSA